MRSFGSIEKSGYSYHRVHASEKPNELVMKFYSLARSCTQANSTQSPQPPLSLRETPLFGRVRGASALVLVQPNTTLNSPLSGDFLFYRKGIYLNGISLYR